MQQVSLNITYTEPQWRVFFESRRRFRIVQKGGRVGFTRGAAQAYIQKMAMADKPRYFLWGDETLVNVRKYFKQYFRPILQQIGKEGATWHWSERDTELRLGNGVCHFRSADRPYRWEGFGYHEVFLNEAGLILRNPYIWEQAVQKTLLDYPDSIMIAAGVPKGHNMFTKMIDWALDPLMPEWEHFLFSTYDNPFIPVKSIDDFVERSPEIARQEIFGEILGEEESAFQFVKPSWVDLAFDNWRIDSEALDFKLPPCDGMGGDPSGGGDECTLTFRHGLYVPAQLVMQGAEANTTLKVSDRWTLEACKVTGKQPHEIRIPIRIDYIGVGKGVHDEMKAKIKTVIGLTGGAASTKMSSDKLYRMANDRTWWWWYLGELLNPLGKWHKRIAIQPDPILKQQLCSVWFEVRGDVVKREDKDKTKKRLNGKSPDRAESMVYAFSDFKRGGFGYG
jgi:hypothetical protein